MNRWKTCPFHWAKVLALVGIATVRAAAQAPPVSVPDGFVVERVADDRLAHDCFCMTLDAAGRPVVSGPGYLRTLIDDNSDGVYDRSVDWTPSNTQGAQGLWMDGNTLYWVADGGLWRSLDSDGDGVSNSRPERLIELPTGREHDAHAIRRGPDGYWYLIAGNFASNIVQIANDAGAPVTRARAGTLWRMSPDFSKRGVWAHGLRNTYDFDFLPDGQVVTYDSDDEREATLPWYRPTRVCVLGPGSDAGWCGFAWKDDDYRTTMPLVLARLGRGSPTGVAVYEHVAFPERYRDAVLVSDWTFGRVIAIFPSGNLSPDERIPDKIPSEILMQPDGTTGFAPTATCIAPDGSILVSVGGRGTMGAVYRVRYAPSVPSLAPAAGDPMPNCFATAVAQGLLSPRVAENLATILKAPSPWSAWSMAQWQPRATPEIRSRMIDVALGRIPLDGPVDMVERMLLRSAQMLTRVGEPVPAVRVVDGIASPMAAVRTSAWWLASRRNWSATDQTLMRNTPSRSLSDVRQGTRWEAHLGSDEERLRWEAWGMMHWPMARLQPPEFEASPSGNALRRTWLWAASRSTDPPTAKPSSGPSDGQIAALLFGPHRNRADKPLLDAIVRQFDNDREAKNPRELTERLTLMQSALGDRRGLFPLQTDAPADASDGYRALYTLQIPESDRNNDARWVLFFAALSKKRGWDAVHAEAVRTMAMMEPSDPACMAYMLDQITPDTHPTSDIHVLSALAQCAAPRSQDATHRIASSLAAMVRKVKARGLNIDSQWAVRLGQLVAGLSARDASLGSAFVALDSPCDSDDLPLLVAFPPAIQDQARAKIRDQLRSTPPEQWSVPLVKFAVASPLDESMRGLFQRGMQMESLRGTCLEYLSQSPQADEYALYLGAIEALDRALWPDAWRGLSALEMRDPAREFGAMAKLVSASLNSSAALPRPAILDRARRAATATGRPPPPSTESWPDWTAYLQGQLDERQWSSLVRPGTQADVAAVLKSIEGLRGNSDRGLVLFQSKCVLCHGSPSALGPSLAGVAKRFSREDLARAIYEPSRDVPDRYRAVRVRTVDDEVLTGMSIYTSADGVTLQAADGSILRINQDQIQQKDISTESLMPTGLLEDRSAQDVADLFAYLGTLQ